MQIPQALPLRTTQLVTDDPGALASVQPERGREYVQLERGRFEGSLHEQASGRIAVQNERWSCGVRVRCARPRSYVAFSALISESSASWCAVELERFSVLEIDHDWEITTRGPLEYFSFAVEQSRLESVEASLEGGHVDRSSAGNRVLATAPGLGTAGLLRSRVASALALGELPPQARHALENDLLYFASVLRRGGRLGPAQPESTSRRRRAIRRVEEYLDAHEREVPSIAELCAIACVSERTLEYAFREQIGVPPARYLRLRRLNAVHRELLRAEPGEVRVTDAAMRRGFWELGRFAGEYRVLFGERPSATLAGPVSRSGRARPGVDDAGLDADPPLR